VDGRAEEHLRIRPLEDAGDAGVPLELLLEDRPVGLVGSLVQRNRLAWPHRRRGLASDGVRYAGARNSVGRRFRSVTKLRLEWYGGVFLLLQQHSKHPRETVITPKASTSQFPFVVCV